MKTFFETVGDLKNTGQSFASAEIIAARKGKSHLFTKGEEQK